MNAHGEQKSGSRAAFPSTSWTLIRQAQLAESQEREDVLNELLNLYWKPLYACYRAAGKSRQDAEDLVQGFLHEFVAKRSVEKFGRQQVRFRTWMRSCAVNYLRDSYRKQQAQKRHPQTRLLSLDELASKTGKAYDVGTLDPAASFNEAWRRDLLERALRSVEEQCKRCGRSDDFRIFVEYYCAAETDKPTWRDLAPRYGLDGWKAAACKADWVKGKLAREIRRAIATYVQSEAEIDDEIRELLE